MSVILLRIIAKTRGEDGGVSGCSINGTCGYYSNDKSQSKRHHDKSQFKDSSVKSLREKSVFCLNFSFVGQQRSASELSAFLNVTHCEREVH